MNRILLATSALGAIVFATVAPATAQSDVQVISGWTYDSIYAEGWSVEDMFDSTELTDPTGEEIGDVENVIFSNDGEVLGIIAEIGGVWDIGDTHVHVPWNEVAFGETIQQAQVPVTDETLDDYDVYGNYWDDEQIVTDATTDSTQVVDDDLVAGSGIFKATDLIGDYVYLSDGARYGYVSDIIVQDGRIAAIVSDAGNYGRGGYYAYPYSYRGVSPMASPRYDMPYGATDVETIENFNYEQLQSRVRD